MLTQHHPLALLAVGGLLLAGCFETSSPNEDATASTGTNTDSQTGPSCSPDFFVPDCVQGDIVYCSDEGQVQTRGCGPRSRCEVGSDGPDCVWRIGEACEGEYEQCADPGGILACEEGFWRFEGCPLGGACSQAECFEPGEATCDWPNDEPYCEGGELIRCLEHGFEVASPCGSEESCRTGTMGGDCVPDDSVPCDPEASTSTCLGPDTLQGCTPGGWTFESVCSDGRACFEGPIGATCRDENTPACDPVPGSASCEGGVATSCHPLGYEQEQVCETDQECLIDESCVFTGCPESAMCVGVDAELCDEPLDTFCIEDTLAICFAGRVLPLLPCDCIEGEDGAQCSQDAVGG